MPRLPTMRVMGSHAISTRPSLSSVNFLVAIRLPPDLLVAGGQVAAGCAPFRLVIERVKGDFPEPADRAAVEAARQGRDLGTGRFVHERHEFVRESGHRAADTDAADVRAPSDAVDPSPFRHVAP